MKIYKIRNKETNSFIQLRSGHHTWTELRYCKSAIRNHNFYYPNNIDGRYEIVEFNMIENKIIEI